MREANTPEENKLHKVLLWARGDPGGSRLCCPFEELLPPLRFLPGWSQGGAGHGLEGEAPVR